MSIYSLFITFNHSIANMTLSIIIIKTLIDDSYVTYIRIVSIHL